MTHTTKHTPGPWHLSECATQTTRAGIVSVDGLHITDVNGYGMTDSQNQANATLLAAAPAMYEALKAALDYYRGVFTGNTVTDEMMSSKLEQALAQAEGRSV